MSIQIQFRRGLAVEWAAVNPVLADGELGLEKTVGSTRSGTE